MSMDRIWKHLEKASGGAQQIGEVILAICEKCPRAAEMVAQDLEQPNMGFDSCYKALYSFAKKHQTKGSWCCGGWDIDPKNPVIRVILDFYHIPAEWLDGGNQNPKRLGADSPAVDLMDLL